MKSFTITVYAPIAEFVPAPSLERSREGCERIPLYPGQSSPGKQKNQTMKTIKIEELESIGIKSEAAEMGVNTLTLLGETGSGDERLRVYECGAVRVAETNGDPIWEEADPHAFQEILEKCGIE